MTVDVIGWSDNDARALVNGVRVIIRRNTTHTRWLCDQHGDRTHLGHCAHTQALADSPAHPERKSR